MRKTNIINANNVLKVKNLPYSFIKRFNTNEVDFKDIVWLYWDWTDWCQYWEVIPTEEDIKAYNDYRKEWWWVDAIDFLNKLW